jgi:hypothetical protein
VERVTVVPSLVLEEVDDLGVVDADLGYRGQLGGRVCGVCFWSERCEVCAWRVWIEWRECRVWRDWCDV